MQLAAGPIIQGCSLYQQQHYFAAWSLFSAIPYTQLLNHGVAGQAADCAYRVNELTAAEELYLMELARLPDSQPRSTSYRFNLSLVYFRLQNWDLCVSELEKVRKVNPNHQRSTELLIQAYLRRGTHKDVQEALSEITKELHKNPLNRALIQTWAEIRWLQGQQDWHLPYSRALQLPGHDALLADYIVKLTSLNLLAQAERVLRDYLTQLTRQNTNSNTLYYCRALLYYYQGKAELALKELNELPSTWLSNYAVEELLIKTLLAIGKAEEALVRARKRVRSRTSTLDTPRHGKGTTPAQVDWALFASALKFSGRDQEYRILYDFDRFVKIKPIVCPPGYVSLGHFHETLIKQLDTLHDAKNHPINQSLRSGSQTQGHLFEQNLPAVRSLELAIREQVESYIQHLPDDANHPFLNEINREVMFTGAWSVKLRKQGFHRNHVHNEGWISGCYYIQIPSAVDKNGQGWIKFGQIESLQTIDDTPDYLVKPHAGQVVLFPSYMWHGTQPFSDESFRITVAFDLISK